MDPEIAQMQQNQNWLLFNLLKTRRRLYAAEAQLELVSQGRKPALPVEFRAQFGEDAFLWDLFEHRGSGFFIEAGAFDGYHFSSTYALEALGWKGLLVEAIPERCEQCRVRRAGSRVVHAALGDPPRGSALSVPLQVTEDAYGGALSTLGPARAGDPGIAGVRSVSVPYKSMDELLDAHLGEIDAVVIDVEGAELAVLRGFDLRRARPKVILIEDDSGGQNRELAGHLQAQPYVCIGDLLVNRVYVRGDLASLVQRGQELLRLDGAMA
jgi:FkbM family methyltransferase